MRVYSSTPPQLFVASNLLTYEPNKLVLCMCYFCAESKMLPTAIGVLCSHIPMAPVTIMITTGVEMYVTGRSVSKICKLL